MTIFNFHKIIPDFLSFSFKEDVSFVIDAFIENYFYLFKAKNFFSF